MTEREVRQMLTASAEEDYKAFNEKLQTSKSPQMGVRLGEVRKIARALAKDGWQEYVLRLNDGCFHEEKLAAGMSIFYSKADIEEKLRYTEKFIPYIDGWGICDSVCSTIKLKKDEIDIFWDYALKKAVSGKEFEARFGLVSMLQCFVNEKYIDRVIDIVDTLEYAGYYDSMAAAWLLAECMIKFPDKTFEYMKTSSLDATVYNKAISKMRESYRVSSEMKDELKKMKKAVK